MLSIVSLSLEPCKLSFFGLRHQDRLALIILLLTYISPPWQFTCYVDHPESCAIIGDPDVYGIGIRISYYLAFWAGIVAITAENDGAVRDARKGVWIVLTGIYAILQPWVWSTKLHQGSRPSSNPIYAFFDLYDSKFGNFTKFASICSAISSPAYLGIGIFIITGARAITTKMKNDTTSFQGQPLGTPNKVRASLKSMGVDLEGFTAAIAAKVKSAMVVSYIWKGEGGGFADYLHADDSEEEHGGFERCSFTSTRQLVPFLIGLFTFVTTVWSVYTEKKEKKQSEDKGENGQRNGNGIEIDSMGIGGGDEGKGRNETGKGGDSSNGYECENGDSNGNGEKGDNENGDMNGTVN
ncbi:hypothetical protein G7Y89_g4044 [Cudoniella acicularis]|uniref:Uncharacterized protein n=1 Tax=Cudoniella acicularis TaxID=354080 RepID=A0A8H4RQ82_9HELO|nr:hypothetical protein G7Y89_g4044 [Cudoniella acicularis]